VAGDLRGIHAALQAGADVNHEQRSGPPVERFTPLMAACYRGHVQVGGREQRSLGTGEGGGGMCVLVAQWVYPSP
jgi:hypothetical protein